jgi:cytochrome c
MPKRALVMLLVTAGYLTAAAISAQTTPTTVWGGVYSTAQAQRGKTTYAIFCAGCHADDLAGTNSGDSGAPPLKRDAFMKGSTAGALFTKIRRTMPLDAPGSLKDSDVRDVIAFLFEANGFPTGLKELPEATAELELIKIEPQAP